MKTRKSILIILCLLTLVLILLPACESEEDSPNLGRGMATTEFEATEVVKELVSRYEIGEDYLALCAMELPKEEVTGALNAIRSVENGYRLDFLAFDSVVDAVRDGKEPRDIKLVANEKKISVGIFGVKEAGSTEMQGAGFAVLVFNTENKMAYIAEIGFKPDYQQ